MSTSRSQDGKTASPEEPAEKKKAGSPGRYSLADEGEAVPSTRIDSTMTMPAVRVDAAPKSSAAQNEAPGSVRQRADSVTNEGKGPIKKPPLPLSALSKAGLDAKGGAGDVPASQRMPLSQRGGGVPISQRAIDLASDEKRPRPQAPPVSARAPQAPVKAPEAPKAAPAKPAVVAPPKAPVAPKTPEPPKAANAPEPAKALEPEKLQVVAEAAPVTVAAPEVAPATQVPATEVPAREVAAAAAPELVTGAEIAPIGDAHGLVSSPPKDALENPLESFSLELDEGSIAFAFDALVSEDRPSQEGTHQFDLAPVRELFAALAANHMRHVRDFMIDVKWGDVTRDWINICLPPVRTLRRAAERLDLAELGVALEKLGNELETASAVGGHLLDASEKKRLLDTYGELVTILPSAFALDSDKTQREGVIVQALLLQVPDVRKVTIDKMTAAGLTSLADLFSANAGDIAHVAGIPLQLATRIVERVQAYRAEIQSSSPQDARAAEREKLAGLHDQLKRAHDAYEAAANGWGPEAKAQKRDHFRAREEKWLEISVLLARFGEVERLTGIEKVPFAQRIAQLTDYLEEVRNKYREDV